MRIYVAGPYSAPSEEGRVENMNRAIDIGVKLMERGLNPYIPHLTHYIMARAVGMGVVLGDVDDGIWHSFWLSTDREWLRACDCLYYIGPSVGANMELAWARDLRMPIFYSMDDVDAYIRGMR